MNSEQIDVTGQRKQVKIGDANPVICSPSTTQRNITVEPRDEKDPNGGYGWVCVACVFGINAHTWGLNGVSNNALL